MKRTQIALAAVALVASTAAMADVTLYGTVDAAVEQSTGNGTYLNGAGGFVAGNNFGIKGSEDLGNGLKANFTLQQGFNLNQGTPDNGGGGATVAGGNVTNVAGTNFNQVASVGLGGDFGTITLGQQLSPFIATMAGGTAGNGNFFVNAIILGGSAAGGGANQAGGFFVPNAMSYTSPSIGGFTATVLTSSTMNPLSGSVTADATNKYTAGSLSTSFGAINIGLTADERSTAYRNVAGTLSTSFGDIGIAATMRSYKDTAANTSFSSYSGSVSYNVSEALTIAAQYASGNDQSVSNAHAKYALSKSTFVYASAGRATGGAQSSYLLRGVVTTENNTVTSLGVVKSF
jgi:predicted porin